LRISRRPFMKSQIPETHHWPSSCKRNSSKLT